MEKILLPAHAKINLSVDVTGRLENGYHTLDMIMQTISLKDTVILEKKRSDITVCCDHTEVPGGMDNICYQAAQAFFEKTATSGGIHVMIQKQIPPGAGLAGGSANAAAVIKGLNILYNTHLTLEQQYEIGLKCGADVPFCLTGGTCRARGIGEVLTRLPSLSDVFGVLVMPDFSVSTEWVYKKFRCDAPLKGPDTERLITAIQNRDIGEIARKMINVLESVTVRQYPELTVIKQELKKKGALGSLMSGSGPSVFGLFEAEGKARNAFRELKKQYRQIYLIWTMDGGEKDGKIV